MTRISPLCVGSVQDSPLFSFSLAPALPSKTSSGRPGLPSFGSFIGTTADSDSSVPFISGFGAMPSRTGLLKAAKTEVSGLGDWVLVHMVSPLD